MASGSLLICRFADLGLFQPRRPQVLLVPPGLPAAQAVLFVPLQRADLLAGDTAGVLLGQEESQRDLRIGTDTAQGPLLLTPGGAHGLAYTLLLHGARAGCMAGQ